MISKRQVKRPIGITGPRWECNRGFKLTLDRPARNLIAHASVLLAVEPSLLCPILADLSLGFKWPVVLEISKKYNSECCEV